MDLFFNSIKTKLLSGDYDCCSFPKNGFEFDDHFLSKNIQTISEFYKKLQELLSDKDLISDYSKRMEIEPRHDLCLKDFYDLVQMGFTKKFSNNAKLFSAP